MNGALRFLRRPLQENLCAMRTGDLLQSLTQGLQGPAQYLVCYFFRSAGCLSSVGAALTSHLAKMDCQRAAVVTSANTNRGLLSRLQLDRSKVLVTNSTGDTALHSDTARLLCDYYRIVVTSKPPQLQHHSKSAASQLCSFETPLGMQDH